MVSGLADRIEGIPATWRRALTHRGEARVERVLDLWSAAVAEQMPRTIEYLCGHVRDVELTRYGNERSGYSHFLLYVLRNQGGETFYVSGGNPLALRFEGTRLERDWPRVPASIRRFYEELHNGLGVTVEYPNAFPPVEVVEGLSEVPSFSFEGLEQPRRINPDSSYAFFYHWPGDHVVVDLDNCANDQATIWWESAKPSYGQSFWRQVDAWFVVEADPEYAELAGVRPPILTAFTA